MEMLIFVLFYLYVFVSEYSSCTNADINKNHNTVKCAMTKNIYKFLLIVYKNFNNYIILFRGFMDFFKGFTALI